ILFANKITLYLNIIFSDRLFLTRPHKIALLPVKLAMKKAIEKHHRLVESISIWQNGQVVRLTAIQIPLLNSDE
ncbi:hypothetical protein, partial [Nostoc sp.]|uniref:hypothetical protein n=1 Tax=Nostoc sp. TaxID=1180 RepID=UPI002FF6FFEE